MGARLAIVGLPLLVVAAAFVLRLWRPSGLGIDHYDEAVYAFSAMSLFDADRALFPNQILFAPPVYFSLVGVTHALFSIPSDVAAVWVSVVLGTATVGLVAWVGRAWFGPGAGAAAAVLVALNEFHIGLSRAALTDITFSFLYLLAVYLLVEALARRSLGRAVVAGVCVGLAWNTKYHGWLAVVVVAAAVAAALALREREGFERRVVLLAVAGTVAALCYLPWALFIESHPGGYAAMAEYQRGFLRLTWLENAWWQIQFQLFLEGPWSRAAIPAALAAAVLCGPRAPALDRRVGLGVGGLAACALVLGGAATQALLALASLPLLIRNRLGGLTIAAWLLVWGVLTPLYRPYARLALPLAIGMSLAAGALLARLVSHAASDDRESRIPTAALAGAAALAVGLVGALLPDPSSPWQPARGHAVAAERLLESLPEGASVFVIGEPSLAYYLDRAGGPAFEPIEGPELVSRLESDGQPRFVVTGIYARMSGTEQRTLESLGDRLQRVAVVPFEPRDLRLLDDGHPAVARAHRAQPTERYVLKLFRYVPGDPDGSS